MPGTEFVNVTALINETLAILGVLSAGQATDPEDFSYVQGKVDPTIRKLAQLEICYAPDTANIPGEWFNDLAAILAGECANKFGATPDDLARLVAAGLGGPPTPIPLGAGAAALSLKQQLRGRPTFEPLRAYYF